MKKLKFMNKNPEELNKLGLAGKLTKLFLYNKVLAILTIIIIIVWGTLSFVIMPKQYNPEIIAPAFIIITDYPNASSDEVYELITRPMEDKISELTQIDTISSQSISGGRSIVTVKFEIGSSQEDAKISLNQKIQDNIGLKPLGAVNPIIKSIDPDDVPIIDIGLSSDIYSESSLRKMAYDIVDELKRTEGVSKVEVVGGRRTNLNIVLNGNELAARNISLDEISSAINANNNIYTTDVINGSDRNTVLNIVGNIENEEDLAKLVIKEQNGVTTRLRDIAEISYSEGQIDNYVLLRNRDSESKPVVHIALSKLKGKNATTVAEGIRENLEKMQSSIIPKDVSVYILKDEGKTASKEIGKLTFDLMKSIIIVAVLLMVFLGVRNSMVATVSIPLILLVVFGFGLFWGQTVNRITLFALILALGLLVDDAIVVIENIARYFRLYPKGDKKKIIIKAVDEVGSALALSTATMALAFIPMAFVTGMMGPYMGPIPFFVPVSLVASLILSVTINPFLAYLFTGSANIKEKKLNIFLRGFSKIEKYYERMLTYLLEEKSRYKSMILAIGIMFIFSVLLIFTPSVPFRMLPKADRDQFYVYLDFPQGTRAEKNKEYTTEIEDILFEDVNVKSVESFIGIAPVVDFNGLFRGSSMRESDDQSTIRVNLISHEDRDIESEDIARKFRKNVVSFKEKNPGVEIKIVEDPPGPPVLSTFLLKIKGVDQKVTEEIALDMAQKTQKIKGVVDVDVSKSDHILNYTYEINSQKAQLMGISSQSIVGALRMAVSGSNVGVYHANNREARHPEEEYVVVRLVQDDRDSIDSILSLAINSKKGDLIYLSEVLNISDKTFKEPIISDDRQKTVYVSGEMENRSIVYASIDLLMELKDYQLKDTETELVSWSLFGAKYKDISSGREYTVEVDGEWKLTLEVFRDLGVAMLIAIFVIYFVLATKIKSLTIPVLIMISIPLGLIGVFPGFALLYIIKGTYFNATSMIGIIALAGLSVKNSVIFLEYLEPLRESGMSLKEALVETGRIRLLPIVLTSLTAILGSLTIISDPVWEGLAWTIIFGLTASTFLTLVVFPIIYYMAQKNK